MEEQGFSRPAPPVRPVVNATSSPAVYFLIGAERSGTTLLRLMLDHHPSISCGGEFNFATEFLNPDGTEPPPAEFEARLSRYRAFVDSACQFNPELSYTEQVQQFFRDFCGDGEVRGATVHFNISALTRYWPEAKFIHLIRDPRDVAPSAIKMGWSGNMYTAARRWDEAEAEIAAFRAQVGEDRLIDLRFEDLVSQPVQELTRLAEFLGLEYDPLMLSYPEHTTYPAPDASAAARWKKKMPVEDVQLVEARLRDRMIEWGYELSGHPAIEVDAQVEADLERQDRKARRAARVERYGWPLVTSHWLAKRLRWEGWHERTVQKMIDIDRAHLR